MIGEWLLTHWRLVLALSLAGLLWLQTDRLDKAQHEIDTVQATFDAFKATVKANGERAEKEAKDRIESDKRKAQEADNEARKHYKDLDTAYLNYRMRVQSGHGATVSLMPAAAPGAANDQICFPSREALDRAITGVLDGAEIELAQRVQQFDKAALTAKICRDWSLSVSH